MKALPNVEQSYAVEFVRKSIHICSLSIPIVYYFVTKATALWILIPLALVLGASDFLRFRVPAFGAAYSKLFDWLLRSHERDHDQKRLNGATYVLLSAIICIWLFPKVIFITSFAILIVSDTLAALIGRRYGRVRFLKKSRAGSLAFFFSAVGVAALTPKLNYDLVEYFIGFAGALVGTMVESLSTSIDDNISIPLTIGIAMWLLYVLMIPGVDVFAMDSAAFVP